MKVMDRQRLEENLNRLQQDLVAYAQTHNLLASAECRKMADSILLAHSTSDLKFETLCRTGRLKSPAKLHDEGYKTLEPDAVERVLGTSEFVFLYAGAFSFPSSGCGLLFSSTLEIAHSADGAATPFDSGGLVNHFTRADMSEPVAAFFSRHELPLSEHRHFLHDCLHLLFSAPQDYLEGRPATHAGSLGLSGGDAVRRHTHEVRIPHEVPIRSQHLQAVFVPYRLTMQPEIEKLLTWCLAEGYDVVSYGADRENDFTKLKTACIQYLRRHLS
ncbi:hypothetical protein [Prosthecobacter sp.]|uniref:hypothetical protein n=1 Tax=Prosthecobacter sp. TaxID=1965333 RepID=UPI0024888CD8|nr:hypothetical protein [Prosthecobacter sp.]MDI1310564.1 hypothetical protein [Prosthecobacter sp.]